MERFLVAFEAPDSTTDETYEAKWDTWVSYLHSLGLQIPNDLDPVEVVRSMEIYEVVAL